MLVGVVRCAGDEMSDIVYVLINAAMPGLVKIGITNGDVASRLRQLDTTSTPLPFECFYAAEVRDAATVERAIHTAFGDHRVRQNREFFKISPDKPKAIIALLCIRDVTPGVELFAEPDDKEAVAEAKKRRAVFRFSSVGITPGAILQSVFDDNITCIVRGDRRIEFRGEETSLSRSALQIAHEKGLGWSAVAGPDYWKYDGKTLSEWRDDKVDEDD
jgi:T5orf172 domain